MDGWTYFELVLEFLSPNLWYVKQTFVKGDRLIEKWTFKWYLPGDIFGAKLLNACDSETCSHTCGKIFF